MNLFEINPYIGFNKGKWELDLSGWMMIEPDNDVFDILINEVKPKAIIEVGTWKGLTAIHMGKIIKKNNLKCIIYCVDTWLGSLEFINKDNIKTDLKCVNGYPTIYYQFLYNVIECNMADIIKPIPNTSSIAYQLFKYSNIKADLIFIDGSHNYNDVKQDIYNYHQILDEDGIMFGDDYSRNWPMVRAAVDDYANNHDKKVETILKYWIYR